MTLPPSEAQQAVAHRAPSPEAILPPPHGLPYASYRSRERPYPAVPITAEYGRNLVDGSGVVAFPLQAKMSYGSIHMRWVHLFVIVLFAAAVLIFVVQNFAIVTMSFLGFSARAPLALLVALVYVLGMATGGSLWSLLRRSFHGSKLTIAP